MSNPGSGLNLIEDNITAAGGFPRATMGGYQRQAVDDHVTYLEQQIRTARRQLRADEAQIAELREKVAARPGLDDIDYSDLGGHAGQMLSAAQAQAREILDEANAESEQVRNAAAEHASRVRGEADREAADLRQGAVTELAGLRAQLESDAAGEVARARDEAAALITAAQQRAESVREQSEREARDLAEQARLEAEHLVASATRQAGELRASVAAEREQTLAELARDHSAHVERTTQTTAEARRHQEETQQRLAENVAEASRIRTAALEQAEKVKLQSLRETEERVATANRQAKLMQEQMQDKFARHKDTMRREIEVLRHRRKAMISQLSQLADHVRDSAGGFDADEADELLTMLSAEPEQAVADAGDHEPAGDPEPTGDPDDEPTRVIPVVGATDETPTDEAADDEAADDDTEAAPADEADTTPTATDDTTATDNATAASTTRG